LAKILNLGRIKKIVHSSNQDTGGVANPCSAKALIFGRVIYLILPYLLLLKYDLGFEVHHRLSLINNILDDHVFGK